MSFQLSKSFNRWVALIITASSVTGATLFSGISQFKQASSNPATPVAATPAMRQISALGRVQPEQEVIKLTVPTTLNNDRVAELRVQRNDRIHAGQVVAVLDSRDRLQDALTEAKEQVNLAQAELAQVQAGAKSGEIAAQQSEIDRLQAELQGEVAQQQATILRRQSEVENAQVEFNRNQALYQEGAIAASQFDQKRLRLQTAQAQLEEDQSNRNRTAETLQAQIRAARATLNQIAEVRPVDVQVAQKKVDQAIAAAKQAETTLQQAYVRSPIAGQILEIFAHPGERVGDDGIAEIGQTSQMEVIAEVYQTDIAQVKIGQSVVITSESFAGNIRGTVRLIGLQVSKQKISNDKPGENLDRRVIDVRIRLDPAGSQQVVSLTNLQVQVVIQQNIAGK